MRTSSKFLIADNAEQVVRIGVFDRDRNDIAGFKARCVAQMDFAVDFRRIGL